MLPSHHRLRRADEIVRVRRLGHPCRHPLLSFLVLARPGESLRESRFAFVVGRRLGKAAHRNRIKRRLREAVRRHVTQIRPGFDCVIIARPPAAAATFMELEHAIAELLDMSGLRFDQN